VTVQSNKSKKKNENRCLKKIKSFYNEYGIGPIILALMVLAVLFSAVIDEQNKLELERYKVATIKKSKPHLLLPSRLFINEEEIITNYTLVKMDDEYKIDVLDDKNNHVKFIPIFKVKVVEKIKD